jgi:hypothetical protein
LEGVVVTWPDVEIGKDEAIAALRKAAWTPEDEPERPATVHSMGGSFGCDHYLDEAIRAVMGADKVMWTTHVVAHDLAVIGRKGTLCYEVPRPERAHVRVVVLVFDGDAAEPVLREALTVADPAELVEEIDRDDGIVDAWDWRDAAVGFREQVETKAGWGLVLAARARAERAEATS